MARCPKQYGTKTKTKGDQCNINTGKVLCEMVAGKSKRVEIDEGYALHSGTVRFADGTEHNAFFFIDEQSSGELCGMMVVTLETLSEQGSSTFLDELKRTSGQVFPYKYRILGDTVPNDIHIEQQY